MVVFFVWLIFHCYFIFVVTLMSKTFGIHMCEVCVDPLMFYLAKDYINSNK